MGEAINDLCSAIDRELDEGYPITPEREAKMQELLEQLCAGFLDTDAAGQAAIRAFIAGKQDGNFWLMLNCARSLAARVTGPDDVPVLRLALAAVSIDDCGLDYRDTGLIIGDLYSRAKRAGIDAGPLFEAAAAVSTDHRTNGGCDSVAKILRGAGPR